MMQTTSNVAVASEINAVSGSRRGKLITYAGRPLAQPFGWLKKQLDNHHRPIGSPAAEYLSNPGMNPATPSSLLAVRLHNGGTDCVAPHRD